ncbi:hypothetical protein HDV00_006771 [Rhizophlyctis rosea]|nr:hypothetical protein HDV00_006771 [Rhizophlyctis rosea]
MVPVLNGPTQTAERYLEVQPKEVYAHEFSVYAALDFTLFLPLCIITWIDVKVATPPLMTKSEPVSEKSLPQQDQPSCLPQTTLLAPRTFLVPEPERSPPLAKGWFTWILQPWRVDEETFVARAGEDNYAVVYYCRQLFLLFAIISVAGVVILWPIHGTGDAKLVGLNILTFGNVGDDQAPRFWSNLLLSYIYIGVFELIWARQLRLLMSDAAATIFFILRMCAKASELHHEWLLAEKQKTQLGGYTLLLRDIPEAWQDRDKLYALFDRVQPGRVVDVILHRHTEHLNELHSDHLKARGNLEKAIVKFQKAVAKHKKTAGAKEDMDIETNGRDPHLGSLRPKHKTGFLGLTGPEVDSIIFYRDELHKNEVKLQEKRDEILSQERHADSSCFVIFSDLFSPHVAAGANLQHIPGYMGDKYAGVEPESIVWENLGMEYLERNVRTVVAYGGVVGLVVSWGFISEYDNGKRSNLLPTMKLMNGALPATAIQSLANLDELANRYPALSFFHELPARTKGFLQGVLPSILVSILYSILPILLRCKLHSRHIHFAAANVNHLYRCQPVFSKLSGIVTYGEIENAVVGQYYGFLVFNVLLVSTVSSSIFKVLQDVWSNPNELITILATTIPTVSNFFVNYVILQGGLGPAMELLQIVPLILKPLILMIFTSTPRQIATQSKPPKFQSGVALAKHSFIATLGIVYAVIAPMVSLIALIYFGIWATVYTHNMQYIYANVHQTGGFFLHRTSQQLFLALYIHEFVMLCLFLLKKAWVHAALMILAFLITLAAHHHANIYDDLMKTVPADMAMEVALKEQEIAEQAAQKGTPELVEISPVSPMIPLMPILQKPAEEKGEEKWAEKVDVKKDVKEGPLGIPTVESAEKSPNASNHTVIIDDENDSPFPAPTPKAPALKPPSPNNKSKTPLPALTTPEKVDEKKDLGTAGIPSVENTEKIANTSNHTVIIDDEDDAPFPAPTLAVPSPNPANRGTPSPSIKQKTPSPAPTIPEPRPYQYPEPQYEGPPDYEQRFLHPAIRSAKLKCWVPSDVYDVGDKDCKPDVVADGHLEWEDYFATMDADGKVTVSADGIANFEE